MKKQQIVEFLQSLGLDTFGFIPCREFQELKAFYETRKQKNLENEFEESDVEKRIRPAHYMEDAKTILSIAFPYYHEGEGVDNGFSIYTKRMDYHRVVHQYLEQICEFIKSLGGNAEGFVDSNTLPERYIAYLAGVGFLGKNNMLITKKYGSYVFLGEILMNLELSCEDRHGFEEIKDHKECGACEKCLKECPSKSINKSRINPNICLSYLTQKKEVSQKEISLLKGNVFGCDFCQLKCPYNEQAETGILPEFQTLDYMDGDLETFVGMDNKFFKEKVSGTSCGWRGKNVIRRNAMIGMQYRDKECDLNQFRGDSPYMNRYIDLLMGKE